MRKTIFWLVLLAAYQSLLAQTRLDSLRMYYQHSILAYSDGNYPRYLEMTEKALRLNPNNYALQYNYAAALALNGKKLEAIAQLDSLVEKGLGLVADNDPDFQSLNTLPEFKRLQKKIRKIKTPVNRSYVAFTLKERDLIPEGIAYDPVKNNFYLSSTYKCKIVRIDSQGNVSDFTSEKQDSLVPVVSVKVDPTRRYLWALSSYAFFNSNTPRHLLGTASIYRYDIDKGTLLRKYTLPQREGHYLNDFVLTKDGNLFITDSRWAGIYYLDCQQDTLMRWLDLRGFNFPNGITITPDEKCLYVAYSNGIIAIDIATKQVQEISSPRNILLANCDGLYFYQQSLIGIQSFLNRVVRFELDKEQKRVVKYRVLESYNPDFINPTTGVIVGKYFYFIANSQNNAFDAYGNLQPVEKLKDILILKNKL
jgi:sugar lactone lactonase YvrE